MAVRSDRLVSGTIPAGSTATLFTVPEAHVVLLKYAAGYTWAATPHNILVMASRTGLDVVVALVNKQSAGSWAWEGWLALDGGSQLKLGTDGSTGISFWLSGAILPGEPANLPLSSEIVETLPLPAP